MKDFTMNRDEMITTLEMALAFALPILGGFYFIARMWG